METSIIKIGNSRGLRLSKTILEKYNIKEKVELILEKGQIILRPIEKPRKNWENEFKKDRINNNVISFILNMSRKITSLMSNNYLLAIFLFRVSVLYFHFKFKSSLKNFIII